MKQLTKSYFFVSGRPFIQWILVVGVFMSVLSSCTGRWEISNPYQEVDWSQHEQYKANFHTHTTNSDGRLNPHTVVDKYHELGYDILAITDHNEVTYPWTDFESIEPSTTALNRMESAPETMPDSLVYENRDPAALMMIDIQANELSRHHHTGSFFNDHNGTNTEVESLEATAAKNGVTMLYHPGRYHDRDPQQYNLAWYLDLYRNYDHLVGMEVYNQGDRYPEDRKLWDSVLTVIMPERPVWGYSNDDMHSSSHLGRNWSVMVLPELTHESVRYGIENGLSYFIYAPEGHSGPSVPVIEMIEVNPRKGTIEIVANGHESVRWISEGEVVSEGSMINLNDLEQPGVYVRAELSGPGSVIVNTQPFGVEKLK